MKTLLLRLEGPMQAWGTASRFTERDTGLEPSKSGVVGLLCAALGKPRLELPEHAGRWPRLEELARLHMGVLLERPGKVGVDFQTAGGGRFGSTGRRYGVVTADGDKGGSVMSWRYFLQDASFLVGLGSSDGQLLDRLREALQAPVWPLYLGRKSYVPSSPVFLRDNGLQEGDVLTVLLRYLPPEDAEYPLRIVLDDPEGLGGELRADVPLDYARRRFGQRPVRVEYKVEPVQEEGS